MEEGVTVAATDALMAKMIADGKLPKFTHLYLNLNASEYAQFNSSLRVPEDNQLFYSDPEVAKVYQLIGTAWSAFYTRDPGFFLKFNTAYYAKVQNGLVPDDAMVRDVLRSIVPSVNGQSIDTYLATNTAFNPN